MPTNIWIMISMTERCIFCKLVRNESPMSCIYRDESVLAFLDIRPVSEGHTLLIPLKHFENIYEMPDDEVAHMFMIAKKVALAIKIGVEADGIRIVQNNGSAAGQDVFHAHVHIIPAYEGKEMHRREVYQAAKLDDVARRIKPYL